MMLGRTLTLSFESLRTSVHRGVRYFLRSRGVRLSTFSRLLQLTTLTVGTATNAVFTQPDQQDNVGIMLEWFEIKR